MACSCKESKKVEKLVLGDNAKYEKKGLIGVINAFGISVINKIAVIVFLLLITPIVIIVILFNFIFNNRLTFTLPKFMINKMKNE